MADSRASVVRLGTLPQCGDDTRSSTWFDTLIFNIATASLVSLTSPKHFHQGLQRVCSNNWELRLVFRRQQKLE